MATDVSNNLMRAARRGVVPTTSRPAGAAPTGVFKMEDGPADGQLAVMGASPSTQDPEDALMVGTSSDAMFAELFGGGAAAPVVPAPTNSPATSSPDPQAPVAPAPAATSAVPSRAQRFASAPAAAPVTVQAAPPARAPAPAPTQREAAAAPVRSWSRFVDANDKAEAVTARQAMAAAKVITPLVAAVSFAPGSASAGEPKSKALTEMLVGMHRSAVATAETISEHMGKDVPSWMVTQLMQTMSLAIARRWEAGQGADMDALAANMRSIMATMGPEFDALVKGASEDAYVEVNHPDIARFRISVSTASAAWTLYDWVMHPRLSVDDKGDMPSRFFTYQAEPSALVNKMLVRCVNECRALVAQVESADLRTAHMQSSIARMANLIGAEYVTRTRHIMNWIGDPAISDAEYKTRLDTAVAELDTRLLPEIYEYARVNFLRIEQSAFRTIEDLNEKHASELVPGGGRGPAAA